MAACVVGGCGVPVGLARRFQAARTLLRASASVACRVGAAPGRQQSTGPSEPGAFQPPSKPVIVDKRHPSRAPERSSEIVTICFLSFLGIEICFELYNPRIQEIQVVKLEKRLDDSLLYLRDALPEYSTFDVNMKPVAQEPSQEVPVNKLKVKMKPKPWSKRWERPNFNLKGIRFDLCLTEEQMKEAQKWSKPWLEFDMMREYDTSKIEAAIWDEIEASKKS
ncbi:PREDICTED: 39S ribosomal protein L19, mitochondrial [Galeopterus variegatus]|uniref:Large ribosomal subunit protein bL19m n=1 Tax=Galeopterus variegatus TaxID=482537 RepID=A0ABM0S6A4_GALVR|nr:PREDICTED: 39S ribosomal protein L19, mitochondrial [Galeopterus variegatus]